MYPTSRYVTARDQFYQALPRVSTGSNKRSGEKAWVQHLNLKLSYQVKLLLLLLY